MKWVAIAVAALVSLAVVLQLVDGAPRVSGSIAADPQAFVVEAEPGTEVCQLAETSYDDTAAYQLTIGSFGEPTPPVDLVVTGPDGAVIANGHKAAGWDEGVVSIPLAEPTTRTVEGATVCLTWPDTKLALGGGGAPEGTVTIDGAPVGGRLSLIQRRPGEPSLIGSLGAAARHYDDGAPSWLGGWTLFLVGLLALGGIGVAASALGATGPRRIVVATLMLGTAWALLTPAFHVPDEVAHFAYTAHIVEAGDLPPSSTDATYSAREDQVLNGLRFYGTVGVAAARPPWTANQERVLRDAEDAGGSRRPASAGSASANPPLYYLLQAPAYALTRGGSVLDQVLPMRLISVLLGALTVLFCFLFLRQLLPNTPWAWGLGAAAVALNPLFGFITGGVNADALLFAAAAAVFWQVAAILRSGLTKRTALGLGAALAVGALTKPLFLALVPLGVGAIIFAAVRQRAARRWAVVALGVAFVPVVLYMLLGEVALDHPYLGSAVTGSSAPVEGVGHAANRREELSYVWQLFAPRLPGMNDLIAGVPLRTTWFNGFVGRFGWLDYGFADWVTNIAVFVALIVLAAAIAAVIRARPSLWHVAILLLGPLGVAAAVGVRQYDVFAAGTGDAFLQARYLLPLLALYGAIVALAAKAFGRRGPLVAVVLIGIAALHELSAMLLTVGRYYV